MSRVIPILCLLPLAVSAGEPAASEPDPVTESAPAAQAAPADADEARDEQAAGEDVEAVASSRAADGEAAGAARDNAEEVTTTVVRGERFVYSMTLKRAGSALPRITCSEGRRTGSHFRHRYCRTDEMAVLEREAAQEWLREAARNRGN